MQLTDWISAMERIAPSELACEWDNVGLLVSPAHTDIRKVLVALDCTAETAAEAADGQYDLLLTHHPQFFKPLRRILSDTPDTAPAYRLIRGGVGHYAAHTNFDAAPGGVNDVLAGLLHMPETERFGEFGRIGTLSEPMTLAAFTAWMRGLFGDSVHTAGNPEATVRRVACVGGSGCSELEAAVAAGADTFLTGECKHSDALRARLLPIAVVAAGHYETEHAALPALIDRLQQSTIDVQYKLAQTEQNPFWRLSGGET